MYVQLLSVDVTKVGAMINKVRKIAMATSTWFGVFAECRARHKIDNTMIIL